MCVIGGTNYEDYVQDRQLEDDDRDHPNHDGDDIAECEDGEQRWYLRCKQAEDRLERERRVMQVLISAGIVGERQLQLAMELAD